MFRTLNIIWACVFYRGAFVFVADRYRQSQFISEHCESRVCRLWRESRSKRSCRPHGYYICICICTVIGCETTGLRVRISASERPLGLQLPRNPPRNTRAAFHPSESAYRESVPIVAQFPCALRNGREPETLCSTFAHGKLSLARRSTSQHTDKQYSQLLVHVDPWLITLSAIGPTCFLPACSWWS